MNYLGVGLSSKLRIEYRNSREFRGKTLDLITKANQIIALYQAQGYVLTLRQLYYQLVSKNIIQNTENEYKRLSKVMTDARYAGLVSWGALEDRTRSVRTLSHWESPEEIIGSASTSYHRDLWEEQRNRVEVWVEKDALLGVLEPVCERNDVSYFSCRGNTSASEMWVGAQRLIGYERQGHRCWVLYLGDHDPSGVDMTRDVQDRLREFRSAAIVRRLALNLEQITLWNPPPQPAKKTDSRYRRYLKQTRQTESWELDALDPATLSGLVESAIVGLRNDDLWQKAIGKERDHRNLLSRASNRWQSIVELLESEWGDE